MEKKLSLQLLFLTSFVLLSNGSNATSQPSSEDNTSKRYVSTHAGSSHYPPLEFINQNGIPDGYIVDLRKAIAKYNNEELSVNLQEWNNSIELVKNSETANIALIPTVERSEHYDFSPPFHYVAHAIFSYIDGDYFENIDKLSGRRVAVVEGAYAASMVEALPETVSLVESKTELECLQLVIQLKADACIEGILSSNALIKAHNLQLSMNSPPFWPRAYVFAVKKGNTQLLDRINDGLAAIVVNGTFSNIYEKWEDQLEWQEPSLWQQIKIYIWILIASISITLLTLLWIRTLKRKVAQKTISLRRSLDKSRKLRAKLEYEANHDKLTGLLNREGFLKRLNSYIAKNDKHKPSIFLLIVQMRNLYSIIMSLGYDSGLHTLAALANRLREIESDKIVHLGSGLFALSIESKYHLKSCMEEISEPLFHNKNSIEPELIFSSVTFNPHNHQEIDITAGELLRRGVTALAYVREKKLKYLPYTPEVEPDPLNLQLLNDFNKSRCSNFVLNFQPQINLINQTVDCFEVLIRWQHPKLGLLPPGKFIPLFEDSGYISTLTRWVISQAVDFLIRNEKYLTNLKCSINITNRDLIDHSFINFVKSEIVKIPNEKIVFEITESEVVEDGEGVENAMFNLRKLGILFAVDDYGTGFSSLSYLNDLPIEEVKIDKLFISNLTDNDRSVKIVHSTIDLAHQMDLTIVAEGVETSAQLAILQELGCDRVQGYFFSKPLDEVDFINYIKKFNKFDS